jgi:hypothetical protein
LLHYHFRQGKEKVDLSMSSAEWEACFDDVSGATYYYNAATNETSWEAPPGASNQNAADNDDYNNWQGEDGQAVGDNNLEWSHDNPAAYNEEPEAEREWSQSNQGGENPYFDDPPQDGHGQADDYDSAEAWREIGAWGEANGADREAGDLAEWGEDQDQAAWGEAVWDQAAWEAASPDVGPAAWGEAYPSVGKYAGAALSATATALPFGEALGLDDWALSRARWVVVRRWRRAYAAAALGWHASVLEALQPPEDPKRKRRSEKAAAASKKRGSVVGGGGGEFGVRVGVGGRWPDPSLVTTEAVAALGAEAAVRVARSVVRVGLLSLDADRGRACQWLDRACLLRPHDATLLRICGQVRWDVSG